MQRVKWILDNADHDNYDIRAEFSSIKMNESPNGLRNDSEAVVAFLLLIDPVPKKIKDKR